MLYVHHPVSQDSILGYYDPVPSGLHTKVHSLNLKNTRNCPWFMKCGLKGVLKDLDLIAVLQVEPGVNDDMLTAAKIR